MNLLNEYTSSIKMPYLLIPLALPVHRDLVDFLIKCVGLAIKG